MKANQLPISLKDAKASLDKLCDKVTSDRKTVFITLPCREDVALVPADELSSLIETLHLLKSQEMPLGFSPR